MEHEDLRSIIQDALGNSMTFDEYNGLFTEYAISGRTSGPKQTDDLVHYTKLNAARNRRILKTAKITGSISKSIVQQPPQTWLIITETWCGDAANSVGYMIKIAELNPNINVRIVLRDENPTFMDQFLTNGARSIPKLIAIDRDFNVLFTWGPRPKNAQKLYDAWKNRIDRPTYSEFHVSLQKWYLENAGKDLQDEIMDLIETDEMIPTSL